ncbi:hypothetical protein LV779_33460 [Streptomyces thinghirensis]|nr:hypothetical protein [Streptomyces thinghirensis]
MRSGTRCASRGRPSRCSTRSPRPTRRAASGSTPSPPPTSRATQDGNVQWLHMSEVEFIDGKLTLKPGTERKIPAQLVTSPWASPAPTGRTDWSTSSAWSSTNAVTSPGRRLPDQRAGCVRRR